MFLNHHKLSRLSLIVGITSALVVAAVLRPPSVTRHQLPDTGMEIASSHTVNRALKADKLMDLQLLHLDPGTARVPQPDVRDPSIKIGCEPPFSAMVSIRSDVARLCIASTGRLPSSDS
jgi:hypothetical protein